MDDRKRWLIYLIILVIALIFFNVKFLGLAISNNTSSEVTVRLPNDPPVITLLNDSLYVCEGKSLFYLFNATDPNADALDGNIIPGDPFFVLWYSQASPNTHQFAIVSGKIDKGNFNGINTGNKTYQETVIVNDNYNSTCCTDSKPINITIIEINNAPVVENIGVQTLWTQGDNSTFYKLWSVNDTEYSLGYGNLTRNISIVNSSGSAVNLFNMTYLGIMNFTANSSTPIGVYNISVCSRDTGLTVVNQNATILCNNDGNAFTVCDNFSLTITNENRAPVFLNYYPTNLTFSSSGTSINYFDITTSDPDGTIPDAYWYVDGVLKQYTSGSSTDELRYTFGCGVSGVHNVSVIITDGLINTSLTWNVNVNLVSCSSPETPRRGGGGGGGASVITLQNFAVSPLFITTTIFQKQGKSFDLQINNTGDVSLNFSLEIGNISNIAILSDQNFIIAPGQRKDLKLYLYALSETPQGVYFGNIIIKGGKIQKEIKIVVEVKEREPLFDLKIIIPKEYKIVYAGDNIKPLINMLNVGLYGTAVDVELYLYVSNLDKVLIYERQKEVIAVETNLSIERILNVPLTTSAGTYLVLGEAKYGNITVSTYDTFNIVEKKYLKISYLIIIAIILALIFLILFIIYKRRKEKKDRGYS
jgi:hypothetical protein